MYKLNSRIKTKRERRTQNCELIAFSQKRGVLKFFALTDTMVMRPTPHQSPYGDSFSSKEKPIVFGNMPKLSPLRGKWRAKHVE